MLSYKALKNVGEERLFHFFAKKFRTVFPPGSYFLCCRSEVSQHWLHNFYTDWRGTDQTQQSRSEPAVWKWLMIPFLTLRYVTLFHLMEPHSQFQVIAVRSITLPLWYSHLFMRFTLTSAAGCLLLIRRHGRTANDQLMNIVKHLAAKEPDISCMRSKEKCEM